MINNFEET